MVNGIGPVVPVDNQDNISVLQLDQESDIGQQQQQQPMVNGNGPFVNQQEFDGGSPLAPSAAVGIDDQQEQENDGGMIDLDLANLPLPTINGNGTHNGLLQLA